MAESVPSTTEQLQLQLQILYWAKAQHSTQNDHQRLPFCTAAPCASSLLSSIALQTHITSFCVVCALCTAKCKQTWHANRLKQKHKNPCQPRSQQQKLCINYGCVGHYEWVCGSSMHALYMLMYACVSAVVLLLQLLLLLLCLHKIMFSLMTFTQVYHRLVYASRTLCQATAMSIIWHDCVCVHNIRHAT